jgi:hypothetical protein
MEAAPVAAPVLIVVSRDEEDPEEVNPEGGEPGRSAGVKKRSG